MGEVPKHYPQPAGTRPPHVDLTEFLGALVDHLSQSVKIPFGLLCQGPLLRQRTGQLPDLHHVKRFADNEQLVAVPKALDDVVPVKIGEGRADYHLEV